MAKDLINVEIKARCDNHQKIRQILLSRHANFKGTDHQIDTYFKVNHGRLKLREGNIENHLIYYERENQEGPKQSTVILYNSQPNSSLKPILASSLGVLTVVDKQREIYFIDNVKFHLDTVLGLGTFMEIEAQDHLGNIGRERLFMQCQEYLDLFGVLSSDFIAVSYSDLLLLKGEKRGNS